jgi:methyl halide transferase
MNLDQNYWVSRYENADTPWDAGTITQPIKDFFDKITDKNVKILIPGAGNAHEAIYLHCAGFRNVYICDWAAAPLQFLAAQLPDLPKDRLLESDFFALPYTDFFDFVIEQTFFCALPPAMRPDYAPKMQKMLKSGGQLVGLMFNFPLNTTGEPPYGGSESEYRSHFEPFFSQISIAPCPNSIKPRLGKELWVQMTR